LFDSNWSRRGGGLLVQKMNGFRLLQAAFFWRLTLAHLTRWAAAILRRAEADIVRFFGTSAMPLTFAQRALWAAAILARPLADIFRLVLIPLVPR
jgi:hypothetical protein